MSAVSEFAPFLHEKFNHDNPRKIRPIKIPAMSEKLFGIRAVIFDVYGTLIKYWREDFSDPQRRAEATLVAFAETSELFGFTPFLEKMNPANDAATTLREFYNGLIALQHEKAIDKGKTFPEVKIEEVWGIIVSMLERHGYKIPESVWDFVFEDRRDASRCMAYFYNFHTLGRGLYEGVVPALEALRRAGIKTGIVSNAQFYTPIDLTLFFRDQTNDSLDDHLELFDRDMIVYSYEEGVAKPNVQLFGRLYDALYEHEILPSQTVFVGNDLIADVKGAAEAGMRTALFVGDADSTFLHDAEGSIIPDMIFTKWEQLPDLVTVNERPVGASE